MTIVRFNESHPQTIWVEWAGDRGTLLSGCGLLLQRHDDNAMVFGNCYGPFERLRDAFFVMELLCK